MHAPTIIFKMQPPLHQREVYLSIGSQIGMLMGQRIGRLQRQRVCDHIPVPQQHKYPCLKSNAP